MFRLQWVKRRQDIILSLALLLFSLTLPKISIAQEVEPPVSYLQNRGQWDESINFKGIAPGLSLWFSDDVLYYQILRSNISIDLQSGNAQSFRKSEKEIDSVQQMIIGTRFVGASFNDNAVMQRKVGSKYNFFIGQNQSGWVKSVESYYELIYKDIYDGIDLRFHSVGTKVEYDFILEAGVDYNNLLIQYDGIDSLTLHQSGDLILHTHWGESREKCPIVYQENKSGRTNIEGSYILIDTTTVGFEIGAGVDPNLPLVIDPVVMFATYLGGSGADYCYDLTTGNDGAIYIAGRTLSNDFPVVDPIQDTLAGNYDLFVSKFSSDGSQLEYCTYLGGSGGDYGYSVAVDNLNQVSIVGKTSSTNFPLVASVQSVLAGGTDLLVSTINEQGDDLVFSTYYGGAGFESGLGLDLDDLGNLIICGSTDSDDFPLLNQLQTDSPGEDAIVLKINSTTKTVEFSTYLGGAGYDRAWAITVAPSGQIILTGEVSSDDFPLKNALQIDYAGGSDIFVTSISPAGDSLNFSTYFGGTGLEIGYSIATNSIGEIFISGMTLSSDYPMQNAFDNSLGGAIDAFVTALAADGSVVLVSSYLGGSGVENYGSNLGEIAIGSGGDVIISGTSWSSDFLLINPISATYTGSGDIFVTTINPTTFSPVFSTYYGGTGQESVYGMSVDATGSIVIGGTASSGFTTNDPYQAGYGGQGDGFILKIQSDLICIDSDGDGFGDPGHPENECDLDNCFEIYNSMQEDYDLDGIGDSCDLCNSFPPVIGTVVDTLDMRALSQFVFYPQISDPDDAVHQITYLSYPHWCQIQNDSLIGLAPDTVFVEAVELIVQDNCNFDSLYFVTRIYLCGDANNDNTGPNISDLTYLVDYLFNDGPLPVILASGDLNGDGIINIIDVTYLVEYMFKGGPPPVCGN